MRGSAERFWTLTIPEPNTGCWLWMGYASGSGYGRVMRGGRNAQAHRVAYELAHGPIPAGDVVMHSCDNRLCVNPAHLRVGTQVENMRDMHSKGRAPNRKGERNHNASLSDADAFEIRVLGALGWEQSDLARLFGVSQHVARFVLEGRTYRHLPIHRDAKFANTPPQPGRSSTSFIAKQRDGRSRLEPTGNTTQQVKTACRTVNNAAGEEA